MTSDYHRDIEQADNEMFCAGAKAQKKTSDTRIKQLEAAYEIAYRATFQGHSTHWDSQGTNGANCPACNEASEARNKCNAILGRTLRAGDQGSKLKMCNFQGCKHTMECAVHRNEHCDCGQPG